MTKNKEKRSCGILIQCGSRYLLVHATKDWAPILTDDGCWGMPKGIRDPDDGDDLAAAIRETFEETGVDLRSKRESIKKIAEYQSKNAKKTYVIFKHKDEDMALMNHKFFCRSEYDNAGVSTPEVDSYYWATKKEVETFIADSHKGKLFKKKDKK
jgi:8-oxo-dGTP pyrophosphatase MutT (NUDIX family)